MVVVVWWWCGVVVMWWCGVVVVSVAVAIENVVKNETLGFR